LITDTDWYDAKVIDNSILGEAFPTGTICSFRWNGIKDNDKKIFEVFNIRDTVKELSGDKAKTQLRSVRNRRNNEVIRSSDQGFLNWKYQIIKGTKNG